MRATPHIFGCRCARGHTWRVYWFGVIKYWNEEQRVSGFDCDHCGPSRAIACWVEEWSE